MNKQEIKNALEAFTKDKDFKLNPNVDHVDMIINRLMANEQKKGLKLCPCRVSDGKIENDIKIICPCNFKTHDEWLKQGRCHCGLFVKK